MNKVKVNEITGAVFWICSGYFTMFFHRDNTKCGLLIQFMIDIVLDMTYNVNTKNKNQIVNKKNMNFLHFYKNRCTFAAAK